MLIGKAEDLRQHVIALKIRFDPYDHVRQCSVSDISERALIIDFVDGIGRNEPRAGDLSKPDYDLIESEHVNRLSCNWQHQACGENLTRRILDDTSSRFAASPA